MNAANFALPLESLIRDLQGEAAEQYTRLCQIEDALLAARREYADTCAELAELCRVRNSLTRLYAGPVTTPAATEAA